MGEGGASQRTFGPDGERPSGEVRMGAESGYGARTRLPYVDVTFDREGSATLRYQISPEEARRFGLILLEVAEAAEQDANLVRFLTGTVGLDLGRAAQVLREFRGLRAARRERETDDGLA